jgi:hypothetical protein
VPALVPSVTHNCVAVLVLAVKKTLEPTLRKFEGLELCGAKSDEFAIGTSLGLATAESVAARHTKSDAHSDLIKDR